MFSSSRTLRTSATLQLQLCAMFPSVREGSFKREYSILSRKVFIWVVHFFNRFSILSHAGKNKVSRARITFSSGKEGEEKPTPQRSNVA